MTYISVNKNQYYFNWLIEDFGFYKTLKYFDSYEIRSPVFTTDEFGQASWFLAIRDVNEFISIPTARCYLVRCMEDQGPESVTIQWQFKITATDDECTGDMKDASNIHDFTKGYSCLGCDLTWNSNTYHTVKLLTLQCQMTECSSLERPIFKTSSVRTKISEFVWKPKTLLEIKLLSTLQDIQYKIYFHVFDRSVSIRICRCDSNSLINCYMLCGLIVERGVIGNNLHTNGKELYLKPFNINDMVDIPDIFKINELCNCRFTSSVVINILIFTSILVEDQSSTFEGKHSKIAEKNPAHKSDATDILNDLRRMYESRIHSDVKLQIGNDSFPAHKCLLASRSPVFSAMFSQDMVENQTGIVNITDMDTNTLTLLLNYIYMDIIDEINYESTLKLLLAAEKYQIFPLKMKCASYLIDVLSEENVCEVLAVADRILYSGLKMSAMDYVKAHANKVLRSDSWKQFVKENPNLAAETLSMISEDLGAALDKNCGLCAISTSDGHFGNTAPFQSTGSSFGITNTSALGVSCPTFGVFNATSPRNGTFLRSFTRELTVDPATNSGLVEACRQFAIAAKKLPIKKKTGEFSAAAPTEMTIKFNPPTETDTMMTNGVLIPVETKLHSITCMKEYENKSFEELRTANYTVNRKASHPGFNFETPIPQTSEFLFRGSATASTSIFHFGQ